MFNIIYVYVNTLDNLNCICVYSCKATFIMIQLEKTIHVTSFKSLHLLSHFHIPLSAIPLLCWFQLSRQEFLHSENDCKNNIIYNNYLASRWCIHNRRIKCLWLPNVTYKLLYISPKFYMKNQRYSKIFEGTSSTVIAIQVGEIFII